MKLILQFDLYKPVRIAFFLGNIWKKKIIVIAFFFFFFFLYMIYVRYKVIEKCVKIKFIKNFYAAHVVLPYTLML